MMKYLILQHPGNNRVYYLSADKMALAELELACKKLSVECNNIETVEIEDIRYLSFGTDKEIPGSELDILSRMSFIFAIYREDELNGQTCLIPVRKPKYELIDGKISSLMKYQGKTNEIFTRMMINVGLLSSDYSYSDRINLLDPVSGKGTTLFEAAIYGFDAYGIEIEPKPVDETTVFFKKFLQEERLKHTSSQRRLSGTSRADEVIINEFEYAYTKDEFKSPESRKKLNIVCGNTQDTYKYFKKEIFNLIVGDLPYGIHQWNTGGKRTPGVITNPLELLETGLPEWKKVLKKGGCVVVGWNSFIVNRQKMSKIFEDNGFEVMSQAPYDQFEHMVDRSNKRDIIVAKKI